MHGPCGAVDTGYFPCLRAFRLVSSIVEGTRKVFECFASIIGSFCSLIVHLYCFELSQNFPIWSCYYRSQLWPHYHNLCCFPRTLFIVNALTLPTFLFIYLWVWQWWCLYYIDENLEIELPVLHFPQQRIPLRENFLACTLKELNLARSVYYGLASLWQSAARQCRHGLRCMCGVQKVGAQFQLRALTAWRALAMNLNFKGRMRSVAHGLK